MTMLPLSGKQILVTRAAEQSDDLQKLLSQLGADVLSFAVTSIQPPRDWQDADTVLAKLADFDWAVFASGNAVAYFLDRLTVLGLSVPASLKIAAVGSATGERLAESGVDVAFMPTEFTAECFCAEFVAASTGLRDADIVWFRGNLGRLTIAECLQQAGANVRAVEVYCNTRPDNWPELERSLRQLISGRVPDAALFASSQSAKSFADLLAASVDSGTSVASGGACVQQVIAEMAVISIGPETTRACLKYLGKVDAEAVTHSLPGLVQATLETLG